MKMMSMKGVHGEITRRTMHFVVEAHVRNVEAYASRRGESGLESLRKSFSVYLDSARGGIVEAHALQAWGKRPS